MLNGRLRILQVFVVLTLLPDDILEHDLRSGCTSEYARRGKRWWSLAVSGQRLSYARQFTSWYRIVRPHTATPPPYLGVYGEVDLEHVGLADGLVEALEHIGRPADVVRVE